MSRSEDEGNEIESSTPLWVKIAGLFGLVVVVVLVVLLIIGSGHGPGRHGGAFALASTQRA